MCEGPIVPCGGIDNPCNLCHIFVLINNIIDFILTCLAPIIGSLMLVIAGIMFMVAYSGGAEMLPGGKKGGPALFSQAKKMITAVVMGLVIIFVSWVFLNTFLSFIGVAEWTGLEGGWWNIQCP